MDTTQIFYSHPSHLSAFKVYDSNARKQIGGILFRSPFEQALILTRLNRQIAESKKKMKKKK